MSGTPLTLEDTCMSAYIRSTYVGIRENEKQEWNAMSHNEQETGE